MPINSGMVQVGETYSTYAVSVVIMQLFLSHCYVFRAVCILVCLFVLNVYKMRSPVFTGFVSLSACSSSSSC